MRGKEKSRPYWFRNAGNVLTLLVSLVLLAGIALSAVRADHAGDAGADDNAAVARVSEEMTAIAEEILATVEGEPGGIESAVGYDREALLALDYQDEARTNYVYWPYLRKGLPLEFMSAGQKALVHDLINTALSARGYLDAVQIMQLEEILAATETIGFPRGTEKYTLAFFGNPAADDVWGWRFEGHHLSLNFTVSPGEISVTPSFFGASPAERQSGALTGFRVKRRLHELGLALVSALDGEQQSTAIEDGDPPFDIVSGTLNKPREAWDDWQDLPATGIGFTELDSAQMTLARQLVEQVVSAYREEISRSYLEQINFEELRFTWIGGTGDGAPHYWRLDGPDFFFEYDLVQSNGNHVHTVWRSKAGDFGADLLMQHRSEDH